MNTDDVVQKLHDLKVEVSNARHREGAYGLLPDVEAVLEQMIRESSAHQSKRDRLAAGLGRIVTDSYVFAESELGTRLLEVADEFAE